MGKSSAINLMLEAIRQLEEGVTEGRRLRVRPFNPWLFSGLETLAAAYVSELARVIDETLGDGSEARSAMRSGGGGRTRSPSPRRCLRRSPGCSRTGPPWSPP